MRKLTTPHVAFATLALTVAHLAPTAGAAQLGAQPVRLGDLRPGPVGSSILALTEVTMGKGALLSQLNGSVRPRTKSGYRVGLHADQSWFPVPYAEHMQTITACFACTDFSEQGGCTMVVPFLVCSVTCERADQTIPKAELDSMKR